MGLLVLVDCLLVAIFVTVPLSALGRVGLGLGTVPIVGYTVAEALHACRPTQAHLARADRFALIAVGTAFALSLIIVLVGLLTGQLG